MDRWWWQVWSLRTLIRYRRMRVGASHAGRAGVRERRLAGVSSSDAHQSLLALFWGMGVWIEPVESYTIVNCPVLAIVDFAKKTKNAQKVLSSLQDGRAAARSPSALRSWLQTWAHLRRRRKGHLTQHQRRHWRRHQRWQ